MFMTLVRISKIYTFLELRSLGQNHSQQLSTTKPQLLVHNVKMQTNGLSKSPVCRGKVSTLPKCQRQQLQTNHT